MEKMAPVRRFGIGEWYGQVAASLPEGQIRKLVRVALGDQPVPACPFMNGQKCSKPGGVCSLREYVGDGSGAKPVAADVAALRITCPNRFKQNGSIYSWIGEVLLSTAKPIVLEEIGFLESTKASAPGGDEVGRIDNILVHPECERALNWCAVETQAVYFSGKKMATEFVAIKNWTGSGLPLPTDVRRPDYRSSSAKRLMPQLETKVPTLRRWGKKMAVVVDRAFFDQFGSMRTIQDVSNCDIAWFIVGTRLEGHRAVLVRDAVAFTTLEQAVEGLTAGRPVTQSVFEERIRLKLETTKSREAKPDRVR